MQQRTSYTPHSRSACLLREPRPLATITVASRRNSCGRCRLDSLSHTSSFAPASERGQHAVFQHLTGLYSSLIRHCCFKLSHLCLLRQSCQAPNVLLKGEGTVIKVGADDVRPEAVPDVAEEHCDHPLTSAIASANFLLLPAVELSPIATERWVRRGTSRERETYAVTMPNPHSTAMRTDDISWLKRTSASFCDGRKPE